MRRARTVIAALLAVEVLDELVFGAREAAWPQIAHDLDLSYTQVGILLGAPFYASAALEPLFGVLGDSRWRRSVVVGGGAATAAALALVAGAPGFLALLVAFAVLFPATGAFVSLSQATLMDIAPRRREVNMTRWAVAGGVGAVAGPLLVLGAGELGVRWRELFAAFAVTTVIVVVVVARVRHDTHAERERPSARAALRALRRPFVVRWLILLQVANLMLDVLFGFLALYFTSEVANDLRVSGVALTVWTASGLAGGVALIALLRRVDGTTYLRTSAAVALAVYPAFLVASGTAPKLALLALLGVVTAGWYSIPKARLYAALPGQSGAVVALGSVTGVVAGIFPLAIGAAADRYGLDAALWVLLAAPLALLLAAPRRQSA